MGGFDPFGYHLADFKAVHPVRKGTVDLVGTHDFTPVNRWMLRAVRSSSEAEGRQQPSRLVEAKGRREASTLFFHCTPESIVAPAAGSLLPVSHLRCRPTGHETVALASWPAVAWTSRSTPVSYESWAAAFTQAQSLLF
jgi:hypothetical protein